MRRSIILGGLLVGLLLLASIALAQTNDGYDLSWWTVDGGGAVLSNDTYTLHGTAGQPDAGNFSGDGYTLAGGFWPNRQPISQTEHRVYIPLVLRYLP